VTAGKNITTAKLIGDYRKRPCQMGKLCVLGRIPRDCCGYFARIVWKYIAANAIRPCDTH